MDIQRVHLQDILWKADPFRRLKPPFDEGLQGVFGLDHNEGDLAVSGELLGERTHNPLSKKGIPGCPYDHHVVIFGFLLDAIETITRYRVFRFEKGT
jgi:hypothetical protein